MAYYLEFAVGDNVTFATPITIPSASDESFTYVWDFEYIGGSKTLFANPASFDDVIRIANDTRIFFRAGATNFTYDLTVPLSLGRQVIKYKKDGLNGTFYDGNNNILSPVQSIGMTSTVYGFGTRSISGGEFSGALYSAQIYSDFTETTLVHDWQPSATGGTGLVLKDTVGANDGTLVNFPVDNSQWIEYFTAIDPTQWTDKLDITTNNTIATIADPFAFLVTEANLPSGIWDIAEPSENYLTVDGVDDVVDLSSSLPSDPAWEIEIEFRHNKAPNGTVILVTNNSFVAKYKIELGVKFARDEIIFVSNDNTFNTQFDFASTPTQDGLFHKLNLVFNGSVLRCFIDGIEAAIGGVSATSITLGSFNRIAMTGAVVDLKGTKYWSDATQSTLVNNYDPSVSNDTTLVDTVGGNNGTLVGFNVPVPLTFDGVDDVVTTGSVVGGSFDDRENIAADWTLDIDCELPSTSLFRWLDNSVGSDASLIRASDGLVRLTLRAGQVQFSLGSGVIPTAQRITIRFQKVPSALVFRFFIDSGSGFVQYGGDQSSSGVTQFNWDVFGKDGGTSDRFSGDLYGITYTANASAGVSLTLDPFVSPQGSTTLLDTIGNNNGTLSGGFVIPTQPAPNYFKATNGGGDLRICMNEDGTGQLPLEIVNFNTRTQKAVLWSRAPSINPSQGFWLFCGKPNEVQPPVTDVNGRNAVWIDYVGAWHLNDLNYLDSTGANNLTSIGTITTDQTSPTGAGIATGASGSNNGLLGSSGSAYSIIQTSGQEHTVSYWTKNANETSGGWWVGKEAEWAAQAEDVVSSDNKVAPRVSTFGANTASSVSDAIVIGTWTKVDLVITAGSTVRSLVDTVLNANSSLTDLSLTGSGAFGIGTREGSTTDGHNGSIAEVFLYSGLKSDSFLETEYTNQSTPNTFWETGTLQSTVGGGGLTIITSPIVSGESFGTPAFTTGTVLLSPVAIASAESVGNPTIAFGATILNPSAIASLEAVGTPIVTPQGVIITPLTLDSTYFVGQPNLGGLLDLIYPDEILTEELFGSPIVTPQGVTITPVKIDSSEVVGQPDIGLGLVLVFPSQISTEEVFGVPQLDLGLVQILVNEILTEEFVGQPSLDLLLKQIFPNGIISLEDVGKPLVSGGDSIVIPINDRRTWQAIASYLRALVFTGTNNDVIVKWLRSEGFEGQINDAFMAYWDDLNYTGTYNDRWSKWKKD